MCKCKGCDFCAKALATASTKAAETATCKSDAPIGVWDSDHEQCEDFCNPKQAQDHCKLCKCARAARKSHTLPSCIASLSPKPASPISSLSSPPSPPSPPFPFPLLSLFCSSASLRSLPLLSFSLSFLLALPPSTIACSFLPLLPQLPSLLLPFSLPPPFLPSPPLPLTSSPSSPSSRPPPHPHVVALTLFPPHTLFLCLTHAASPVYLTRAHILVCTHGLAQSPHACCHASASRRRRCKACDMCQCKSKLPGDSDKAQCQATIRIAAHAQSNAIIEHMRTLFDPAVIWPNI
eukprot:6214539-Pleurochrysis_carterae.AAC.6